MLYKCDLCGYITYEKSLYNDELCISCRKGRPIYNEELSKMAKEVEKKSIVVFIAFLRMMTHGEGYAGVSAFDAGAGGGFNSSSVTVYLERSGLIIEEAKAYSIKDFYDLLLSTTDPFNHESKGFYPSLMHYYEETLDEINKGNDQQEEAYEWLL